MTPQPRRSGLSVMEATLLGLLTFLPSSPWGQASEQGHLALCLQWYFCFSKRLTLGGRSVYNKGHCIGGQVLPSFFSSNIYEALAENHVLCWVLEKQRLIHSATKQTFIHFGLCAKLCCAETTNRETYPQGVHSLGTSLVVQWLRVHAPSAGCLGSIPGWGTRSCLPQLRVCRLQLKIPCATMTQLDKTQHSQVNDK